MSRHNTIGKVATKVTQNSDLTVVRYHQTDVVTITPTRIMLNTGGWESMTTKVRMNQAAQQFALGYSVFQHKHIFHVRVNGQDYPFLGNCLEIDRETGNVSVVSRNNTLTPVTPVIVK